MEKESIGNFDSNPESVNNREKKLMEKYNKKKKKD